MGSACPPLGMDGGTKNESRGSIHYDTAGLVALVTGEREACQGLVASLQKLCPQVKYFVFPGSHQ